MYSLIDWKDEVVEFPRRYKEETNGDGTVEHNPSPGRTLQEGTPQSATNFNNMDRGISENNSTLLEAVRMIVMHSRKLESVEGLKIPVTLTNNESYPFNSSKKAVQISPQRNKKDYAVDVEVLSVTGGAVGFFEITERLANGFKIAYTGSATEVSVNIYVRGGM